MSPDHDHDNEYTPWIETGETELDYYKRRFLEESAEVERMQAVVEAALAWHSSDSSWEADEALRLAIDVYLALRTPDGEP